jgi:acetyl-CoA acetyltransferase
MGQEVAVAGVGMYRFGRWNDVSIIEMGREAAARALKDANIPWKDVQAAYCGYIGAPLMTGIKVMKELGCTGVPVVHVENASATGSATFREAYLAVADGRHDITLAVGFDHLEKAIEELAGEGVLGRATAPTTIEGILLPTAFFAMWATRRMHDYGTTVETLAKIAAKNWNNAALNPYAQRQPKRRVTPEEVLNSRMIAEPLTSMQCCPVGDGAAAAVLCRKDLIKKYTARPAVTVASSVLKTEMYEPGHVFIGPVVGPMNITVNAGREAYEKGGIGPEDLDVVEVHDAFTIEELVYYESLGIAKPGEGDKLVEEGATEIGGRIPFSTSGGLIGRGHPGGPTGLSQIHEIILQLRGDAGDRQVKDAKVGLAHMVGGGSVCVVSILKR